MVVNAILFSSVNDAINFSQSYVSLSENNITDKFFLVTKNIHGVDIAVIHDKRYLSKIDKEKVVETEIGEDYLLLSK